jgi:hypothetical protein
MLQIADLQSVRKRALRVFNGWYFFCLVCAPCVSRVMHCRHLVELKGPDLSTGRSCSNSPLLACE